MFYKAIGYVVWKLAVSEARRRYAGRAKVLAALALAGVLAAGILTARSGDQ